MCGIAGFLQFNDRIGDNPEKRLARMTDSIKHRGPDDWGMAFSGFGDIQLDNGHISCIAPAGAKLALGHRRLSIIDLSPSGRQPMTNNEKTLWIVFNGEIYNYIELREELKDKYDFHSQSDTEVLLAAYQLWGLDMLPRLDGIFAFALWDARCERLFCARDIMGVKPFYYASENGCFYFGSEPRAVLAGLGTTGHLDPAAIAEFLVMGIADYDDLSFYREVKQLEVAKWMSVTKTGIIEGPHSYWTPPMDEFSPDRNIPEELYRRIEQTILRQLRSDVPVGTSLSGGIDSGTIVYTAGKILGDLTKNYTAITISNPNFANDETALAKRSAETVGMKWVPVVLPDKTIGDELIRMTKALGEPFPGTSFLGQFKVMEKARELGITVMLDGQGGDEVFIGYGSDAQRIIPEYLKQGKIGRACREWIGLKNNASLSLKNSILFNIYLSSGRAALFRNTNRLKPFVSSDLLSQVRGKLVDNFYTYKDFKKNQLDNLMNYQLTRLLHYEDRNSMAFGVEARVPLLSPELLDYALRLPLEWKVRDGWTKYALRKAMSGKVPDEILWHKKKYGFDVPEKKWAEASLPQLKNVIAELKYPLDGSAILDYIGKGYGQYQWFWRLITVSLWIKLCNVEY